MTVCSINDMVQLDGRILS